MRELEDFEIEVTIITALSKDDILNLENVCGRQLDTMELLKIAKLNFSPVGLSVFLYTIIDMKNYQTETYPSLMGNEKVFAENKEFLNGKGKTFEM